MFEVINDDAYNALHGMKSETVNLTVTSPPYFRLKDYGTKRQIGWEKSVEAYIASLVKVFSELYRLTTSDGSCFIVIGDSYENNSLQLVPQRLCIALSAAGWIIRNDLIWAKTDAPPESVKNRWRLTHEHVLFLTKSKKYQFDLDAIRVPYSATTISRWGNGQAYGGTKVKDVAGPEGQRFRRGKTFKLHPKGTSPPDVLKIATARSPLMHFATFPISLIECFVLATTKVGDVVIDPFTGSGTTGVVALKNDRRFVGVEVNPAYVEIAEAQLVKAEKARKIDGQHE